ncbi:MAG: DoxX family protein [Leptospira sp.]|nr:DoxX family protein [Leptospira sp.]
MTELTKTQKAISLVCRSIAAIVMLQTLYFKFSGAEESVFIFTTLKMEPWGRYGSAFGELISSILILIPRTIAIGAIAAIGIISGAILSHLTILGINVMNDAGMLFSLAMIVLIASAIALYLHRRDIPFVGEKISQII